MSVMKLAPVYACVRCGRPVVVTLLATARPDETGEQLHRMMAGLSKIAMCGRCKRAYNYYAANDRSEEWAGPNFQNDAALRAPPIAIKERDKDNG